MMNRLGVCVAVLKGASKAERERERELKHCFLDLCSAQILPSVDTVGS